MSTDMFLAEATRQQGSALEAVERLRDELAALDLRQLVAHPDLFKAALMMLPRLEANLVRTELGLVLMNAAAKEARDA